MMYAADLPHPTVITTIVYLNESLHCLLYRCRSLLSDNRARWCSVRLWMISQTCWHLLLMGPCQSMICSRHSCVQRTLLPCVLDPAHHPLHSVRPSAGKLCSCDDIHTLQRPLLQ